ncbi:MAG TPA: beta-ketoacyl synthase N-terminal-like domain-containing protein, partial [Mesotoga sp.]|nr:beta-ketoacyl synthase N-terminal-like domain-containing protein [Mesotoga sp.]
MKRVVITGLGVISPIGNNLSEFWNSLKNGKSGIDWIEGFDTSQFQVKIAGQVKNFDPLRYMDRKEVRRNARFVQLAIASAQEAFEDSRLDESVFDRERAGVIYGVGLGGMDVLEE